MSQLFNDPDFVGALSEAGWDPSRHVGAGDATAAWLDRGHVASEAALEFVFEFDGIKFQYPRNPPGTGLHSCFLSASGATRAIYPSVVRSYERRISDSLCPIGFAASRNMILLMASSGTVFGGFDQFLASYGTSGREAIWMIYHRVRGVRIPAN